MSFQVSHILYIKNKWKLKTISLRENEIMW